MGTSIITQCSVCKRVRQSDGSFLKQVIPEGEVVSHTYCPHCEGVVRAQFLLRQRGCVRGLVNIALGAYNGVMEANIDGSNLEEQSFTMELTPGSFVLLFEGGINLGLHEKGDKLLWSCEENNLFASGQVEDQLAARNLLGVATGILEMIPAG